MILVIFFKESISEVNFRKLFCQVLMQDRWINEMYMIYCPSATRMTEYTHSIKPTWLSLNPFPRTLHYHLLSFFVTLLAWVCPHCRGKIPIFPNSETRHSPCRTWTQYLNWTCLRCVKAFSCNSEGTQTSPQKLRTKLWNGASSWYLPDSSSW